MFDTETFAAIISLPGEMEIEPAALLAVAEVESGGRALFDCRMAAAFGRWNRSLNHMLKAA